VFDLTHGNHETESVKKMIIIFTDADGDLLIAFACVVLLSFCFNQLHFCSSNF
jgi:hypothetical protein